MFSNRTEYAIRALTELAKDGDTLKSDQIAVSQNIPPKFLPHILGDLARAGLVRTSRGYGGGIVLNGKPGNITFKAIVEAVQGPIVAYECLVGIQKCKLDQDCALKLVWQRVQSAVDSILQSTTLEDLITDGKPEDRNDIGR
jgi:Rrf2 family protein